MRRRLLLLLALVGCQQSVTPDADPGLAAFGRGAEAFAVADFARAELEFTRVLEDDAIPPGRLARARYNRGTARTHAAATIAELEAAIDDFVVALQCDDLGEELARDARNNLEVAILRLADTKRRAAEDAAAAEPPSPGPAPPPVAPPAEGDAPAEPGGVQLVPVPGEPGAVEVGERPGIPAQSDTPRQTEAVGPPPEPLPREAAARKVDAARARLVAERRDARERTVRPPGPRAPGDW